MSSTILFLHGLTVDGRDGRELEGAMPEMRVVSPDLPGHGQRPRARDWSPRALAADLASAYPSRLFLVGHSWGAAIALWLAALRPKELTPGLVLLEGGWFDRADLPRRATAPRTADQRAALDALFASRSSEAWAALAALDIPVLAMAGTLGDDGKKAALLARFAAAVPRAEITIDDGVGHDLLRDAPERTCERIAKFIRHASIGSPRKSRQRGDIGAFTEKETSQLHDELENQRSIDPKRWK